MGGTSAGGRVLVERAHYGGMMERNHELSEIPRLVERIRCEYLEMPGLRLTGAQARRLWGIDEHHCDAVLGVLLDSRFLTRTRDGAFVRV